MTRILHFADAHIDIANYGRHDPKTGLPLRMLDFLRALDFIVDTAIQEKVDLVLFAGDAYKDRTPAPTFQREWGSRMMRLSQAGITTLLLVGNHDLSPSVGRAHALQEFETLKVPHIYVASKPQFFGPDRLEGLPLQILALPWVSRSGLIASQELSASQTEQVYSEIEEKLRTLLDAWLENVDPDLPVLLAAHASVQGAVYGGERNVMLGNDLVLPGSMVRDKRLDYVALGHIHKYQDLNPASQPHIVYPGSIERVDFGEANDDKYFVIVDLKKNDTTFEPHKIPGRQFIDRHVTLEDNEEDESVMQKILDKLPPKAKLKDAIVRLVIDYPRKLEQHIDEASLRRYTEKAFDFHLVRRPQMETRIRLPGDQAIASLTPLELLDKYWNAVKTPQEDIQGLQDLAAQIILSGDTKDNL